MEQNPNEESQKEQNPTEQGPTEQGQPQQDQAEQISRKHVVAGNWKMFKTRDEAQATVREVVGLVGNIQNVDIVVCPPFTALGAVEEILTGSVVQLGAQNVHWQDEGAFTGEVSVSMLADYGCSHVIIGHSERRHYFQESDEVIQDKLEKVLSTELVPILCIGESLEAREADRVQEVIPSQLERALRELTDPQTSRIIIAYEPVWAIGTGRTATPELAEKVHFLIRSWLSDHSSVGVADQVRILYGGSVTPENAGQLIEQENIDGFLVGGASLDAPSFAKIVQQSA
ncbi:MAG: triose-phosphate isomerase [Acidobacteria bacterium]|nr:MAG: triose-phosphate isomerase [Acidobacteriota bacterium]